MTDETSTAVLLSAGLDSAVLAAVEAQTARVHPFYITAGLAWEGEERGMVRRLLLEAPYRQLAPLTILSFSVEDLYPPGHWALQGAPPG